jgi:hypothetical protein
MAAATSDMPKLEPGGVRFMFAKRDVMLSVSRSRLSDGAVDEACLCETLNGGGETDTEGVLTPVNTPVEEASLLGVGGIEELLVEDLDPATEPAATF